MRITTSVRGLFAILAGSVILSGCLFVRETEHRIKVNEDGSTANCRIARSSGDRAIDALMCQLTLRHVRFEPARDPQGRPVAQDVTFIPNWWRP